MLNFCFVLCVWEGIACDGWNGHHSGVFFSLNLFLSAQCGSLQPVAPPWILSENVDKPKSIANSDDFLYSGSESGII